MHTSVQPPVSAATHTDVVAVLTGEHGLTYREEYILRLRFGLGMTHRRYTRDDIGFLLGVTRERVRQLERKALAKVGLGELKAPVAKSLPVDELWAQPPAELPPEADAQRSIFFGRVVRDLLARRGDIQLSFIQNGDSGVVHVLTPSDPDASPEPDVTGSPPAALIDTFNAEIDALTNVGAFVTLCGYHAHRHRGGFEAGDKLVHEFADDLLCRACVRELGPHAARAFEHPQNLT